MKRRDFLRNASVGFAGAGATAAASPFWSAQQMKVGMRPASRPRRSPARPKDYRKEPFRRLVILGESTVEGGPWLPNPGHDRYADALVRLINACQEKPIEYFNKGIGANAISPRSPGYAQSVKPSALERYKKDVIANQPDLFILAYGLNDMRAAMPIKDFREDMATIIRDVQQACHPVTVLTTVYYMTGYRSWPPYNQGSIELTLKYNECIRSLAEEFDCILADVWAAEGLADWLIHNDGVHANLVGNLVIAGRIFEAIAQHASGLTNWAFSQVADNEWTRSTMKAREQAGDPFKKTW
ncbi:MAG TPA: GDSL-type esterase/lipase family protein [Terriglobia bacterium]|jgi:lysophospholipase L1-like esterase|nr:GDSL-type esterase/lipase family protein [Terriglobia bacterium]